MDQTYTGTKAIELALRNQYDIIFRDRKMPGTDDMEIIRKIGELGITNSPIDALAASILSGAKGYVAGRQELSSCSPQTHY